MLVIKNVYKLITIILDDVLIPNVYRILDVVESKTYYEFVIVSVDDKKVVFYVKLERSIDIRQGKYKMISNDGLQDRDAVGTVMYLSLDTISNVEKFKNELYFIL